MCPLRPEDAVLGKLAYGLFFKSDHVESGVVLNFCLNAVNPLMSDEFSTPGENRGPGSIRLPFQPILSEEPKLCGSAFLLHTTRKVSLKK